MPQLKEMCQLQGINGEWVETAEYLGCCDCGLVHRMEYRLVDGYGRQIEISKPFKLLVRTHREERLTSQARSTRVFECHKCEEEKTNVSSNK